MENKDFEKLSKIKCEVVKKGNLNYISWAEAWKQLKKACPNASYIVYSNTASGMPYFGDSTGGFVKVGVEVNSVRHIVFLPIMDFRNKSIQLVEITTTDINKAIQRALTKAIAMHGLGLYVYRGEDTVDGD